MSGDDNSKSFWTTLPGILTGVAALLTAVGGLLTTIDWQGNDDGAEPDNSIPETLTADPSIDEPLKINSFGLDYATILEGDSSNLSWAVSGAKKVNILPGLHQVDPEGFLLVSPEKTTEYSLTAMNGTEQVAASVRLEVLDAYCYAKGNITLEVNALAQGRGIDLDINADDLDSEKSDPVSDLDAADPDNDNYDQGSDFDAANPDNSKSTQVIDLIYAGYFKAPFTAEINISPIYGATIVSNESDYPFWPEGLGTKVNPNTNIEISKWPEEKYIWANTDKGGWSKVRIHKTLGKLSGTVNISYMTWQRFSMGG
jgi:hypothetical protein